MSTGPSTGSSEAGSDLRSSAVILVAMAVLTVFFYWTRVDTIGVTTQGRDWMAMTRQPLTMFQHNLAGAFLLGMVPLAAARFLCGRSPAELGLGRGNIRRGFMWLGMGIPLAILVGKLSAGQPEFRSVYPLDPDLTAEPGVFARHAAFQLLYYFGWEVLFRGVLLFGLRDRVGFGTANIIQTALSVVVHFGRPFSETMAAMPAGLAFGGVARHTGSVWYVIIIHWVVGVAQDWFIVAGGPY